MNINNLKEGMVVPNYRKLCELLEVSVKSGNSKVSQMKDFERYFSYTRNKYSFIINEVYENEKIKVYNYHKEITPVTSSKIFKYIDLELNKDINFENVGTWSHQIVKTKCVECGEIYEKMIRSYHRYNSGVCQHCNVSKSSSKIRLNFEDTLNENYIKTINTILKKYVIYLKSTKVKKSSIIEFLEFKKYLDSLKRDDRYKFINLNEFNELKLEYEKLLNELEIR